MKKFSLTLILVLLCLVGATAQKNPDMRILRKENVRRAEMILPQVKGYTIYKADLHTHTNHSDGGLTPRALVREAYYDGLDIIAITDHIEYRPQEQVWLNTLKGYTGGKALEARNTKISFTPADEEGIKVDLNVPNETAMKEGKRWGMLVIPGAEITRQAEEFGHFNVLFAKDANKLYDPDPAQSMRNAKAQGALVMHNHPGWHRTTTAMNAFHEKIYNEGLIDGVEVVNGMSFGPKLINRCLERKLFMAAGTDTHNPTAYAYNQCGHFRTCTFIFAKKNTEKDIRKAIEERRTLAFSANNIIGERSLLEDLFRATMEARVIYTSEKSGYRLVAVTNLSSVPYEVSRTKKGAVMKIPAFSTVSFKVPNGTSLDLYVHNMWTASDKEPNGCNPRFKIF